MHKIKVIVQMTAVVEVEVDGEDNAGIAYLIKENLKQRVYQDRQTNESYSWTHHIESDKGNQYEEDPSSS